jgi:hypothetical protein
MVRLLDVATQGAIRDRSRIIVRNFVLVSKGEDMWGFTDFGEDVAVNVIDGVTGDTVNRSYHGDNAPIASLDPIPMKIGLEVDTTNVVLNHLHPAVLDMVRGHDCRGAVVQIHRGYLDPVSMLLAAPPRIRRLGQVNGAPIDTPAAGGRGGVTLKVVSATRQLTRTNPAKRSDEQQRLRSGDRFRRYGGLTSYDYWWGEKGGNA